MKTRRPRTPLARLKALRKIVEAVEPRNFDMYKYDPVGLDGKPEKKCGCALHHAVQAELDPIENEHIKFSRRCFYGLEYDQQAVLFAYGLYNRWYGDKHKGVAGKTEFLRRLDVVIAEKSKRK